MRRPQCWNCPSFIATEADLGECHYDPPKVGVKVRLILLVNGEEVTSAHARARETAHGYWPAIPPSSPGCRFHPDWLRWKNTPDPLSVGDEDDPFSGIGSSSHPSQSP